MSDEIKELVELLSTFVYAPWELKNVANPNDPPYVGYRPVPGKEDDWFARRVQPDEEVYERADEILSRLVLPS